MQHVHVVAKAAILGTGQKPVLSMSQAEKLEAAKCKDATKDAPKTS